MRSVAWIVAAALISAPAAPPPSPPPGGAGSPESTVAAVVALVHDGRFDAAEKLLPDESGRPDQLFLKAFVSYWRLVFDDDNTVVQDVMDHRLQAVLAAASRTGPDGPTPVEAALWQGMGHLLLAELRASQRHPFGAAFEAKKAKRALDATVTAAGPPPDALFGLGTYNYMADQVPRYMRGLRFLLGIPKGDRDKGLEQLGDAATQSPLFGFEARVLLVTIYANRHEKMYAAATREADALLAAAPEAVTSLYCAARLDVTLGRNQRSLERLASAASRAAILGDVDPVVLRSIDVLRAKAEFLDLRPDLAAETARRALATGSGLTQSIRTDLETLKANGERLAAGIDWSRIAAARAAPSSTSALVAYADAVPGRPLLPLLAGDALLRQGHAAEASYRLSRADIPTFPPEFLGPRLLRQGEAADLAGDRAQAAGFYQRATNHPGFEAKEAAVYYQAEPFGSTR